MEAKQTEKNRGFYIGLLLFVVLIWGISPNVSKFLLGYYSPAAKTAFSSIIAFVSVLIVCAKKLKKLNKSYFLIALPTGAFYSVACVLQQIGLEKTSPAMYSFLENVSILIIPFMVWVMQKARPLIYKFIGAGLCVVSIFVLGGGFNMFKGGWQMGDTLCAIAGLLYGVNIAVTGVKAKKLDAALYLLVQFGVHCVISTTYAIFFEETVFSLNAGHIALSIGITLVSTVFGWLLRTICLKHLEPSVVAVIMPFSSIVVTLISLAVGTDPFSWYLVFGSLIGVLAAIVANYDPARAKVQKAKRMEQREIRKKQKQALAEKFAAEKAEIEALKAELARRKANLKRKEAEERLANKEVAAGQMPSTEEKSSDDCT